MRIRCELGGVLPLSVVNHLKHQARVYAALVSLLASYELITAEASQFSYAADRQRPQEVEALCDRASNET